MTSDVTVAGGKHAKEYLPKSSELVKASMAWRSLQQVWTSAYFDLLLGVVLEMLWLPTIYPIKNYFS